MSDFDYLLELMTRDLAEMLARDKGIDAVAALRMVYNSKTYAGLLNPDTHLFSKSPIYVYSHLQKEL